MKFDITIHIHSHTDADPRIATLLERIMATEQETLDQLSEIGAQVAKIGTESAASLQKITELEAIIAASPPGAIPAAVSAKVAELKAQLQVVDDLVPDAVVTPPDDGGSGGTEVPTP